MNDEKMIFCENCGYANNADAKFCNDCGKPLHKTEPAPTEAEVVEAEAVNELPYGTGESNFESVGIDENGVSMEKNQKALEYVKEICGSGAALLLTLLITAEIALTIYLSLTSPLAAIVGMIPTIIIAIGCWITYISSKAGRPATAGFSMISGVMIFYIIVTIIAFVALAIVYVFAFIKGSSEQYTNLILSAIIVLVAFFLVFLLYKKIRKTVTTARDIVRGEEDSWFSSAYVRFVMWISLIMDILGTVFLFLLKYYIPTDRILYDLQNIAEYNVQIDLPALSQFETALPKAFESVVSWPVIANSAITILVTLFSLILLKKIRKAAKELKTY